jgi:hypothetical protein
MAEPTQTQITTTSIPDYAKPYVEKMLGKAEALTATPYQTFPGQRTADFTGLQQQAFQGAGNLGVAPQIGAASDLAATAGLGALQTQYGPGQFYGGQFGGYDAARYMSPYIEQALAPQLREAQRASDIMRQQNQAQAVGQGAFGGSRSAIVEAERQRNLGTQMGDIVGKGYQTAYEQAANQYNQDMARRMQAQQLGEQSRQFGAGLGLQGLQTALQSAGALGNLGATQFTQDVGTLGLQNQFGTQQQQQQQNILNQQYQDFLTQKQYPYTQLSYMSDMLRGLPLSQSSSQLFQPPPSMLSQVAGLGTTAAGLLGAYNKAQGAKKGGPVKEAPKKKMAGLADLAVAKMA